MAINENDSGDYEYDEYDENDGDAGDDEDDEGVDDGEEEEEDEDGEDEGEEEEDEEDEEEEDDEEEEGDDRMDDGEGSDEEETAVAPSSTQWKVGMQDRAATSFQQRAADARAKASGGKGDIMHTVYGNNWSKNTGAGDVANSDGDNSDDNEEDDNDDLFVAVKSSTLERYKTSNQLDTNRLGQRQRAASGKYFSAPPSQNGSVVGKKTAPSSSSASSDFFDMIRMRFVTGGAGAWSLARSGSGAGKSKSKGAGEDEVEGAGDDDDSVYGDFEDLEETAKNKKSTDGEESDGEDEDDDNEEEEDGDDDEEEEDEDDVDSEADNDAIDKQLRDSYALKKSAAKSSFDKDYDNKKSKVSPDTKNTQHVILCYDML